MAGELKRVAGREDKLRFEREADRTLEMLDRRLRMGLQELERLKDLMARMGQTPVNLWNSFVGTWDLDLKTTGLIELGFAERVFVPTGPDWTGLMRDQPEFKTPYMEPGLEEHLTRMRHQHGPAYEIRPEAPSSELRFPVTHYSAFGPQPQQTNPLTGFDLFTLADHRPAISRAVALQDTACTGRLTDCQEGTHAFRLFIPIYRLDMPFTPNSPLRPWDRWNNPIEKRELLKTVHRERYLKGVLFATIDMSPLIHALVDPNNREIGFRLYSLQPGSADNLLYEEPSDSARSPYLTSRREVRLFGQSWFFEFYTLPTFNSGSLRYWPAVTWGVGLSLSLLLTGIVVVQIRARIKEEGIAADLRISHDTLERREQQLRTALEAQERISRDLHDTVIQSIYVVGLGLQNCRKLLDKAPERVRDRLTENMAELNGVIGQLRNFILNLGPRGIGLSDFNEGVQSLVRTVERAAAAQISLEMDPRAAEHLENDQALEVLNILREAVTNSLRHARAKRIRINISQSECTLQILVEDDGLGFDPENLRSSGHGLSNMAARAQAIGGRFQVVSANGGPTRVRLALPLLGSAGHRDRRP